jgi:hypothetical protein
MDRSSLLISSDEATSIMVLYQQHRSILFSIRFFVSYYYASRNIVPSSFSTVQRVEARPDPSSAANNYRSSTKYNPYQYDLTTPQFTPGMCVFLPLCDCNFCCLSFCFAIVLCCVVWCCVVLCSSVLLGPFLVLCS